MRENAFFSNKGYARKGMTLLVNAMVMFETIERPVEHGAFGEWQLGLKFNGAVVYPEDQSDLREIKSLIH